MIFRGFRVGGGALTRVEEVRERKRNEVPSLASSSLLAVFPHPGPVSASFFFSFFWILEERAFFCGLSMRLPV